MSFIFPSYIKKLLENLFNKRANIMFTCTASKDVLSKTSVVFWTPVLFWSSHYNFSFRLIPDLDIILTCLGKKKLVNTLDILYNSINLKNTLSSNWKINMIVTRNLHQFYMKIDNFYRQGFALNGVNKSFSYI